MYSCKYLNTHDKQHCHSYCISLTVQGLGVKTVYVITSSQEGLENTAGGQI